MFLLAATPVAAQVNDDIFHIDGVIDLTFLTDGDENSHLLTGDVTIGANFAGGFGVALGIEAYAWNNRDSARLYPVLSYTSDIGTFSLGTPRFVLDTLVDVAPPGGTMALRFNELGLGVRSPMGVLVSLDDTTDVFGLRYDGSFENLTVAASYHRIGWESGHLDTLSLGLSQAIGPFDLVAGLESVRFDGEEQTSYLAGVTYDDGTWTAGLTYAHVSIFGNFDVAAIWGGYEVMEGLTVTAAARSYIENDLQAYGIDVEYEHGSGAYASVGLISARSFGAEESGVTLNMGYRF